MWIESWPLIRSSNFSVAATVTGDLTRKRPHPEDRHSSRALSINPANTIDPQELPTAELAHPRFTRDVRGVRRKETSKTMPLLQAAEILVVVGVLLCLVNPFIPMQSSIKSILNAVGSDCGSCVAAQRVRALSFAIPHAHRIVKDEFRQPTRT